MRYKMIKCRPDRNAIMDTEEKRIAPFDTTPLKRVKKIASELNHGTLVPEYYDWCTPEEGRRRLASIGQWLQSVGRMCEE